ncbi:fimbrial protein [Xanthomonas translucens pv. arrhenatheri]|uniref:Type IV pilus assembly protein PilN n=3 Tax=Xanthomonas translucens group TaxID=3390202 RepID=A0A0K3A377_9XANT|nr:PilN domain-containing protein [Xanthomonas translucens]OAX64812.1 fimbrial protein [Xanthomonas translucens pv. arrhenatheri]UKE62776.1 PilN domain-containing protein [Xanthomonas translucens pv. poae]UKE76775.1 PilN domain-containing protein [Xanthomonas translucens pv. arrhenatheri]CTP92531.1 type IV pilus assembly protein PilN [Xanthomonas translucens pv. arrhenatheri LMG 727]CTP92688.1 type IV pilus assembly protein PilN [Xanthomonas translucens pv. poae]
MAKINLLPWRAERRKQREREFYAMLGFAALAGVLLALLVWFYYDRQITGQNERNAYLQTEIDKVKAQNQEIDKLDEQKRRLLARKRVIEELQAKRSQMVHLFDSLVRTIPDGVVLTAVKQEGDILTLEGRSQSNARVSAYMRNLEGSGWMTNPELSVIEAKAQDKEAKGPIIDAKALPYVFTLKVKLPVPGDTSESVPGAAAPAAGAAAVPAAATAPATPPAAAPAATPAATPAQQGPAS